MNCDFAGAFLRAAEAGVQSEMMDVFLTESVDHAQACGCYTSEAVLVKPELQNAA